jgi:hypothetical protein
VRLTTYHHIVPMSRNPGTLTLLEPSGPAWPIMGVLYLYLLHIIIRLIGLNMTVIWTKHVAIRRININVSKVVLTV